MQNGNLISLQILVLGGNNVLTGEWRLLRIQIKGSQDMRLQQGKSSWEREKGRGPDQPSGPWTLQQALSSRPLFLTLVFLIWLFTNEIETFGEEFRFPRNLS